MATADGSFFKWRIALLGALLSTGLLVGCGASLAPSQETSQDSSGFTSGLENQAASSGMEAAEAQRVNASADAPSAPAAAEPPSTEVAAPQLVKRAEVWLILNQVDQGVESLTQFTQQAGGDLLMLRDWQPQHSSQPRQVEMTLRVPQSQLTATLQKIRELGDVQRQSITVEDVSSQLVDLEARLRNLRKAEESLLEIMERSGDIADVLEVSRELSSVRESIERIDAQQQHLKQQVAYSTIQVTLESAVVAAPASRPLSETLGASWQMASQSVGAFTTTLLKLCLWLTAFSPYLAVVSFVAYWAYRRRHRPLPSALNAADDATVNS